MKKIENVIEDCTDCRHAKEFKEPGGNTDFILVCTHAAQFPTIGKLIARGCSSLLHCKIEIPEACPLEDYKTTN
jgi:hypothetical protein